MFDHQPRGVAPTPAGVDFYRHCQTTLGAVEGARQDMRHLGREVAWPLDVGLIPTIAKGALARVRPGFTDDFPKFALRVAEASGGTLTEWGLSGEVDFAIVTEPPSPQDGLVLRLIARNPLGRSPAGRAGARPPPRCGWLASGRCASCCRRTATACARPSTALCAPAISCRRRRRTSTGCTARWPACAARTGW
ncbi:MAG: LysR family transcriptional regulator [Alphaproteobacteria bacterium]|nr:LysR family transcriptional regulator [Alphaproteobacteria bacterium]